MTFRIDGGAWFAIGAVEVRAFRQDLDLHAGILQRQMHVVDQACRETRLVARRLVHMALPYLGSLEWWLTPELEEPQLPVRYRGHWLDLRLTQRAIEVSVRENWSRTA